MCQGRLETLAYPALYSDVRACIFRNQKYEMISCLTFGVCKATKRENYVDFHVFNLHMAINPGHKSKLIYLLGNSAVNQLLFKESIILRFSTLGAFPVKQLYFTKYAIDSIESGEVLFNIIVLQCTKVRN